MPGLAITKIKPVAGTVTVKAGGHSAIRVSDAVFIPLPAGNVKQAIYTGMLAAVPGHPDVKGLVYGVGDDEAVMLAGDVTFEATKPPAPDCSVQDAKIAALTETVKDREDRLRRSSQITTL